MALPELRLQTFVTYKTLLSHYPDRQVRRISFTSYIEKHAAKLQDFKEYTRLLHTGQSVGTAQAKH